MMQEQIPTLELALVRWSVVHRRWHYSGADMPLLTAFLAGWCGRCIGMDGSFDARFKDSFRAGWQEADEQIAIMKREAEQ